MRGGGQETIKKAVSWMLLQLPRSSPTNPYRHLFSPTHPHLSRVASSAKISTAAAATMSKEATEQKRALRSDVRKALRAFSPAQRAQEEHHAQAKELYVPRVEDNNRNMRMLKITTMEDLVANSMNILEPSPMDASGNEREDVMSATSPVNLFLLPGVAFDRSGRRLGRGGGYYDTFLKKYQELAVDNKWTQPLLVALSYSVQIMEEEVIPVTPTDVLVDAVVSPSGVIPISSAASERM